MASAVRPHREGCDCAGHPRAIFKRAIERGNVVLAEMTARELGRVSLEEALQLLLLDAADEPAKFERRRPFGRTPMTAHGRLTG